MKGRVGILSSVDERRKPKKKTKKIPLREIASMDLIPDNSQ